MRTMGMMMDEGWPTHTGFERCNFCAVTCFWPYLLFCSFILAVHIYSAITYDVTTAICNLLVCLLYLFTLLTPVTPSAIRVGGWSPNLVHL